MENLLKKSLFLGFIYFCALLFNACCNCDTLKATRYNATKLTLQQLIYNFPNDSTYAVSPSYTTENFKVKQYGIGIYINYERVAQAKRINFCNTATACKCNTEMLSTADTITGISIITLFNFDASHPEGSEVKDYFKSLRNGYNPKKVFSISVEEYIAEYGTLPYFTADLFLDSYPANDTKMQFAIKVFFKNNKVYSDTTKLVQFKL